MKIITSSDPYLATISEKYKMGNELEVQIFERMPVIYALVNELTEVIPYKYKTKAPQGTTMRMNIKGTNLPDKIKDCKVVVSRTEKTTYKLVRHAE